jgi:hypothetical protein
MKVFGVMPLAFVSDHRWAAPRRSMAVHERQLREPMLEDRPAWRKAASRKADICARP